MNETVPERREAQHKEQKMRDKRDRETQERTPGRGEPRFREGAKTEDLDRQGWNEVEGHDKSETP